MPRMAPTNRKLSTLLSAVLACAMACVCAAGTGCSLSDYLQRHPSNAAWNQPHWQPLADSRELQTIARTPIEPSDFPKEVQAVDANRERIARQPFERRADRPVDERGFERNVATVDTRRQRYYDRPAAPISMPVGPYSGQPVSVLLASKRPVFTPATGLIAEGRPVIRGQSEGFSLPPSQPTMLAQAGTSPWAGYQPRTNVGQPVVAPGGVVPGGVAPGGGFLSNGPPPPGLPPGAVLPGGLPFAGPYPGPYIPPEGTADIDVIVQEARTGRLMFGVGVNSEAGVTGQFIIDERNFDWTRVPTAWDDWINGTAFRGAGQGFRLEAMPGDQVQRYLVSFTEPYLFDTPISFSLSGFFYDRRYFDWEEQRLGGRIGLGYRLNHDLSLALAVRQENINIHDPRVAGVEELDEVVGDNDLTSARLTLSHDTRDVPFAPTEGHLIEISGEQAFGSFDFPRGEIEYQRYVLLRERPDYSGRHTLALGLRAGFTGAQTPIYENYFAGGFSTLRGFDFRGASPVENTVIVGGEFRFLGTVEYYFPLTADDMIKGVAFCDFGTVERDIAFDTDNFRVAPGFGLRVYIPAMGPAPLSFDFAVPVMRADTDDIQNFSFFVGLGR